MKITKDALILAQALGGGGGITPTGNQDISTLDEYDVSTKATARVSATERAKIIPENIKQGETILGVEGSYSGGGASAPSNDVNFYDYDGTIVASYSAADFANLAAMPDNPSHEGLTAQGWNWSLSDAKTYVASYGMLDIGQMYITDDGKTRLYITIATTGRMSPTIYFSQTVANGVTIDWGDNSAVETADGTGNKTKTHTYTATGSYVISLNPAEGCSLGLGHGAYTSTLFGTTQNFYVYTDMLTKAEIGRGVSTIGASAFQNHNSLAEITIPQSVTAIGNSAFTNCYALRALIIPDNIATIGTNAIYNCHSIQAIAIPNSVSSFRIDAGYALKSVAIPTSFANSGVFYNCYSLSSIAIPNGVTSISNDAFFAARGLAAIKIPPSVTSIGSSAFAGNTGMAIYDFTHHTSVPTLSNTNAFQNIPADCQIRVPTALYDTWIAASNWSTYASKIVAV